VDGLVGSAVVPDVVDPDAVEGNEVGRPSVRVVASQYWFACSSSGRTFAQASVFFGRP
jgi:hypothetical protein